MLIGISPCISPELLAALHRMGHGDEIVLADAFFCGDSFGQRILRADGIRITELLDGIMRLISLDQAVNQSLVMMQPEDIADLDPALERSYLAAISQHWPAVPAPERMERFAFYERCKRAFAVVMTGETAVYGNIIIKKGVIPADRIPLAN